MRPDILIVDDSPVMRRFIQRVLDATGLEMGARLEAGNGSEGLAQMAHAHVDLVLADMNMPVMDGATMVRAMRNHPDWNRLPVLIVSTDRSEARMDEMRMLGVDGYVTKPFSPEQLEEKILAAFSSAEERACQTDYRGNNQNTTLKTVQPVPSAPLAISENAGRGTGANGVTSPAVTGPAIAQAAVEILETMCFLEAWPCDADETAPAMDLPTGPATDPQWIGAGLSFAGRFSGSLKFFAEPSAVLSMAANFLGADEGELVPRQLQLVVMELANMICGAILHQQDGSELFTLSSPEPLPWPAPCPAPQAVRTGYHAGMPESATWQSLRTADGRMIVLYAEAAVRENA